MAQTAWALVTSVTPTVQVRFAGDTSDVTVVKGNAALTLSTNDVVKLSKAGSAWLVDYVIGDL